MATPFNQGAPTIPVVLNTSNCFVFGNTASGNALSVQQLGTGNVATFRTTTGATALFVNAAGNVGVGTASPSYQLSVATGLGATATPTVHIADTVGPKSLSVIPNASSGVYNAMVATGDTLLVAGVGTTVNTGVLTLAPWSGSSVGARIGGSSNIFGIYSNATTFYSNAVSPAAVMTVTNGRVGIGTTSPSSLLDLRGGSISLGSFDTSSASRYVGFYNGNDSNGPLVGMEIENTTLGGNYSQKLHFRTHAFGGNNGRRLTIDEYGNVFVEKNLTTTNPYWFITYSSGGNATYTPGGGSWFSSTANGTIYGNSITVGGTASASAFNTTSGTFTFPVAGTYLISVPMFINGATGGRYALATFGSSIKPVSQYFEFTSTNLPTNEMRTWTFVKQVNGNDTMFLNTQAGSITLYLAEVHTTLNIFKVG